MKHKHKLDGVNIRLMVSRIQNNPDRDFDSKAATYAMYYWFIDWFLPDEEWVVDNR